MIPRPPRSTRTDTLFPYTTLFRSVPVFQGAATKLLELKEEDEVEVMPPKKEMRNTHTYARTHTHSLTHLLTHSRNEVLHGPMMRGDWERYPTAAIVRDSTERSTTMMDMRVAGERKWGGKGKSVSVRGT